MTEDAALVAGVLAGDQTAFAEVYDRYSDRLYDFAHSMLRNPEDASDAVADAFVLFAERLPQLREPDRLRPWLYAIVRTECLRRLKSRSRIAFGGDEPLADMADPGLSPDQQVEAAALQQLVWDAAAGLADRDRALLDLHLRQGLDGAELGEAMGVSANNAYVMMNRLRGQLERSLGALLMAKAGRDACSDLDETLTDWDGSFSPLIRKRVARHVDSCPNCVVKRAAMVSPLSLFAGVTAFAAPGGLRERVLANFASPPAPVGSATASWTRRGLFAGVAGAIIALVVFFVPGHVGDGIHLIKATTSPTVEPSVSPTPTQTPTSTVPIAPPPNRVTGKADDDDDDPARLEVSDRSLTFDPDERTETTRLKNRGGESLRFELEPKAGWITTSPTKGKLDPGESITVTVYVSRQRGMREDIRARIDVDWDHGDVDISVTAKAPPPVEAKPEPEPEPDPEPEPEEPDPDPGESPPPIDR